jgi:hypothetical protein
MPGCIPQSRLMLLNQGVSQCAFIQYAKIRGYITLHYGNTGCGVV